jgi:septum formation protein
MRDLPPVILASASPRRAQLLRQLGLEFKVVPSQAPEIHSAQLTALEISRINAWRKARSVANRHPNALVLGADTLVFLEAALYGKPPDLEAARRMLEELQGRAHHVVTAVCLLHLAGRRRRVFAETTAVTFRPLDALAIRRYLAKVNPLDKAGAYAIQEEGRLIIEKISGSFSNVVGLPVERLERELTRWSAEALNLS